MYNFKMKKNALAVFSLLILLLLHGCQINDDDPDPGKQVLVSFI